MCKNIVWFLFLLFVEYAVNGSLYNFLQQPKSEMLTFGYTVQWATDIARGKYYEFSYEFLVVGCRQSFLQKATLCTVPHLSVHLSHVCP